MSCSACGGEPVGGGDRNLFVGSVTIGSTVVLPNDPSVTYTDAPCNRYENGFGILACEGDLVISNLVGAGASITINVWGSPDYDVYPHMQLLVNGTIVGEWDVPGGAQNYSARAVHYYSTDHLGSTSIVTDAGGVVRAESDYYPYGGERMVTGTDSNHYKFTGKERDTETGLDYFGARYYGSTMGRFGSPDPLLNSGRPDDPQTWNRYSYVVNRPLVLADPTGMYDIDTIDSCEDGDVRCKEEAKDEQDRLAAQAKEAIDQSSSMIFALSNLNPSAAFDLMRSLAALGTEGDHNGVVIGTESQFEQRAGKPLGAGVGGTTLEAKVNGLPGYYIGMKAAGTIDFDVNLAHEGLHVANFTIGIRDVWSHEYASYRLSAFVGAVLVGDAFTPVSLGRTVLWNPSWWALDRLQIQSRVNDAAAEQANAVTGKSFSPPPFWP